MRFMLAACLAILFAFPTAAQGAAYDRTALEITYGPPDIVDARGHQGYLTALDDKPATLWLEYDEAGKVARETVIFDTDISLRELGESLPALRDKLADPASELFLIRAYPRDELGARLRDPSGRQVFVRFFLDSRQDKTRINTHSRVKAFTLSAAGPAERRQPLMADDYERPGPRDGAWVKVENFFRPGLHFAEKLSPRKATKLIVIHHSKIENMNVAAIHDLHLKNGWAGIGYHKVILPDGSEADGRPEATIGAHALGANRESLGIVVVGDFDASEPMPAQMASLVSLTSSLMRQYAIGIDGVVPHRAVTAGTTCPGLLFPWDEFKEALAAKLSGR